MTTQRMRIECCITKATNTHSDYVMFIAFSLQQWLQERATMLSHNILPIACLVILKLVNRSVRLKNYISAFN